MKNKVLERNKQLEETTVALKEFNITLEEEINERTKREEEIIYLSYHDQLIGLYIADAYDAMTSERSYRSALSEEIAIEELQKNVGSQFDPELVSIFVEKVLDKLKAK